MKNIAFYKNYFVFLRWLMIELATQHLQMSLHLPEDGFYRGTRFDHSGVWDSLLFRGVELCGRWFTAYNPLMHDVVCGPAEEFSLFLPASVAPLAVKVGVGLLQLDNAPYDRFKLYPVLDGGEWTVKAGPEAVRYCHRLKGFYEYEKTVALTGEASFEIRHELRGIYEGEVYNHNFFTMGKMEVGPSRLIDFPFTPDGTWRAAYDSVGFTASGVRFSRRLGAGESVYCGNINARAQAGGTLPSASYNLPKSAEGDASSALSTGMPYQMSIAEGPLRVSVEGSVPVSRTVLWANHRIACLEPYNTLSVGPAAPARWTVRYALQCADT